MNKVLTIVIPTYNMEQYLKKNLESFCLDKVLEEIEVIIVNDGSTDSSETIAKEYVLRYPNTYKLINKTNAGHGSAINVGILNAKGLYFKVVDADDWVEKKAFCNLIESLKKSDADIVYSNFYWAIKKSNIYKTEYYFKSEFKVPFQGIQYRRKYMFDEIASKLYIKMHNMTIKTTILKENNINIDENCYYVDTEYILYPIPYVRSIMFLQDYVYMYRIGHTGQSVSIESLQKNEQNYDKVLLSLFEFYNEIKNSTKCSREKLLYISKLIARVVAGKIKIILSYRVSKKRKKQLQNFDQYVKEKCYDVYNANNNMAIVILRKTRYQAYYIISTLLHMKK